MSTAVATITYTFDNDLFSDLHKDAYGFRPSGSYWGWLKTATDTEKQEEWDSLITAMKAREASRKEVEKQAAVRFESIVTKTLNAGAATRAQAIEWLMDSENIRGDVSYFEYLMGIPYGYVSASMVGTPVPA